MVNPNFFVSSVTKREGENYFFNGNTLVETPLDKIPRNSQIALTVRDKDFISYFFEIDKGLDKETEEETVEVKMFQEAGLNPLIDYKFAYHTIESKIDVTKINVRAFAININTIKDKSKNFLKHFGFIDSFLPTTTLPFSLYSSNILEKSNDIFIYFVNSTLYLSIFNNGQFIFGKTIDTGLFKIREDFIRKTGEEISIEKFTSLLISKGIVEKNYQQNERYLAIELQKILTDIVVNFNSIFQYVMRSFSINNFSRLFVGTKLGTIPGIAKLFEELLGVEGNDYLFYCKYFSKEDNYIDQRDILLFLELENHNSSSPNNPFNLTLNNRPDSFLKRESGRFISFIIIVVFLSSLFPLIPYLQLERIDSEIEDRLSELRINKQEFNEFKLQERKLITQRESLNQKLKKAQTIFQDKKVLIDELSRKIIEKKRILPFLNNLFFELNSMEIKVRKVFYKNKIFTLDIEGKKQQQITGLIQNLTLKKNIVTMESINFEDGIYRSTIEVVLK